MREPFRQLPGDVVCTATAHGYACNRPGMELHNIHHDPDGTWWIAEPANDEERTGIRPMSGYRIITDSMLPRLVDSYDMTPDERAVRLD